MDWNKSWGCTSPDFLGHGRRDAEALLALGKKGTVGNSSQVLERQAGGLGLSVRHPPSVDNLIHI